MFIFKKENVLSEQICQSFIDEFEKSPDNFKQYGCISNSSKGIHVDKEIKDSLDLSFNPSFLQNEQWAPLLKILVAELEKGLVQYVERWSVGLSKIASCEIAPIFNMQKYEPGGGYFDYHCERIGTKDTNSRALVWMLYLNDVYDGGETEFFYYHQFEPARRGKLVIWPPDFTHTHRGITSPTETKYIVTGWYNFKNL